MGVMSPKNHSQGDSCSQRPKHKNSSLQSLNVGTLNYLNNKQRKTLNMPTELKVYIIGSLLYLFAHIIVVSILTCINFMEKGKYETYLEYMMFHSLMGTMFALIWPASILVYGLIAVLMLISFPFSFLISRIKDKNIVKSDQRKV